MSQLERRPGREVFATLDGLRGVAALAVVSTHYKDLLGYHEFGTGALAVDFFFVLSGFVLAYTYEPRFRRGLSAFDFIKARLIRLYPLYFFAVALVLTVRYALAASGIYYDPNSPASRLDAVLLSLAFLPAHGPTNNLYALDFPAWSLFFELAANLAYGLIFPWLTNRVLAIVTALSFAGLCLIAVFKGDIYVGVTWDDWLLGLVRVSFSFFAGVLVSRIWSTTKLRPKLPTILLVAAVAGILYYIPSLKVYALYDLAACFAFPLIVFLAACNETRGALRHIYLLLGAASYAIYVLQVPLREAVLLILNHAFNLELTGFAPWSGLLLTAMLVGLALALDKFYDIPVRSYLTALTARRQRAPSP